MSRNRLSAILDTGNAPIGPVPGFAFVLCPAGMVVSAVQQWIYQMAYERAREEVALMARRRRMYAVSLN